jgi:hypothetical protein
VRDIAAQLRPFRNLKTGQIKAALLWGNPKTNDCGVFLDVQCIEVCKKNHNGISIKYACTPTGVWASDSDVQCNGWGYGSPVSVWNSIQYDSASEAVWGEFNCLSECNQLMNDRDGVKYMAELERKILDEFGPVGAIAEPLQMELAL